MLRQTKLTELTAADVEKNPYAAVAHITNTAARPGALTTEWWTVLIAGAASAALAVFGVSGPAAAQVAGIAAPMVLALVYAFVRAHTKGALADALKALFPQADDGGPPPGSPANGAAIERPVPGRPETLQKTAADPIEH